MKRYTVNNIYGIPGGTVHKSARLALIARDKREGRGWIVTDERGARYDWREVGARTYRI